MTNNSKKSQQQDALQSTLGSGKLADSVLVDQAPMNFSKKASKKK